MNLVIIGLPKAGKTTLGKRLSTLLRMPFVDTDEKIEKRYQMSVRELFKTKGEPFFRSLEEEVLKELVHLDNTLISLGGGIVTKKENHPLIKKLGTVFYLKTPVESVWKRIQKGELPAYLSPEDPYGSFLKVVKEREQLYEALADLKGGSVD